MNVFFVVSSLSVLCSILEGAQFRRKTGMTQAVGGSSVKTTASCSEGPVLAHSTVRVWISIQRKEHGHLVWLVQTGQRGLSFMLFVLRGLLLLLVFFLHAFWESLSNNVHPEQWVQGTLCLFCPGSWLPVVLIPRTSPRPRVRRT